MAQGKVEICGVNTAKLPILNEKEKEALFVRIKAGDQEAKEEYIKGNLRLAEPADASVANEYHFVFKSGSTATELVHPSTVNVGSFSVESNKVYEVSILEGLLTSRSWSVN